jgi:hypothetical protein
MKDKIVKTCLNIDCPERFSLCCHAGSRSASEPEILLGVPAYFCAKCGKEFKGGKCTAGEKELPNIIELTERIVIDFANLTGRETESRAEFRALVYKQCEKFVEENQEALVKKVKDYLADSEMATQEKIEGDILFIIKGGEIN